MNIALWGTGLMGYPMAERLLRAGHQVSVYNRTLTKAAPLREQGALVAEHPARTLDERSVLFLMLSDYKAILSCLDQVPSSAFEGKSVIQMGTILPSESLEIQQRLSEAGADYLECPVLGSRDKASQGQLILMVGGERSQFEFYTNLLKVFGQELHYIGAVGQAAALKLALNQMIISLISAFSLSLGMIRRSGVSTQSFMSILRESALYAPTFDKKLDRLERRDFSDPNFPVKHMDKDVGLILEQVRSLGLDATLLEAQRVLLQKAMTQGFHDGDYSAISQMIDPLSS